MSWNAAIGTVLFIASIPVAGSELLDPTWSVAAIVVGIAAGWLLVPGFWRRALFGAIGGVVSGLLILGPGLRAAMRVVAILDPFRAPEFTIGGTLFIVIGIGGIMGGTFGVIANLARGGVDIGSRFAGLMPAILVMAMIGLDSELRSEISGLGAGPWLNIPMFAAVALGYGAAWTRAVLRLERRRNEAKARRRARQTATMNLSNPRGLET